MRSRESRQPDTSLSCLPKSLELIFHSGGPPAATRAMEAWSASLVQEADGKLICHRTHTGDLPFLPALHMGAGLGSSVYYHFVPKGPEVPVFREFLWRLSGQGARLRQEGDRKKSEVPFHRLYLIVATQCPNCPHAARIVLSLATRLSNLSVHLLEVTQHPEWVKEHDVRSVPTLLIDCRLQYVGALDEERLTHLLQDPDPLRMTIEEIRQKIRCGKASEAAEWIAKGGDPSFLAEDLGRSNLEERIGLLVTCEETLEKNPRALDGLIRPLVAYLNVQNASIRGDIADLLGKIGHPRALPALRQACQDQDPDVREAAREAIERIEGSLLEGSSN